MNRTITVSLIFSLLLVLLHTIGFFTPGNLNWGFHFLGYLPAYNLYVYIVLAIILIGIAVRGNNKLLRSLSGFMQHKPVIFLLSVIALFVGIGFLFKIQAPMWGDSAFMVKNFSEVMRGSSPLYLRNEPLSTYYYFGIITLFQPTSYVAFLQAYWTATMMSGIGFIIVSFFLSRNVIEEPQGRFLLFIFLCSASYMEVFFGYVETYSFVIFFVSLYVLISILFLKGKISFLWVAGVFFFQCVAHYLAVLLFPSMLYLAYKEWKKNGLFNITVGAGIMAVGVIVTLWLADFNTYSLVSVAPHKNYLPLITPTDSVEIETSPYTLLSLYHLLDMVNLFVLLGPGAFFLIFLTVLREKWTLWQSHIARYFILAILPVIAFLCIAKFDLGAAKDWDVIAPFMPLPIVFGVWLSFYHAGFSLIHVVKMVALLTLLHSSLWWYFNITPEPGIKRTYTLLDTRTLSAGAFYAASLHLAQYYHQVKKDSDAVELWKFFSGKFPHDKRGYLNTITNIENLKKNDFDRIHEVYQAWFKADTIEYETVNIYTDFCYKAGNYYFENGTIEKAKLYYKRLMIVNPYSSRTLNNMGSVYAMQDSARTAISYFQQAIALDSLYSDAYYNLGLALEDTGNNIEGKRYIRRAASLGNAAAQKSLQEK